MNSLTLDVISAKSGDLQAFERLVNGTIVWVLLNGILLTAAYELTQGSVAPITAFSIFSVGLIILTKQSHRLISQSFDVDYKCANRATIFGKIVSSMGLYLGLLGGFA